MPSCAMDEWERDTSRLPVNSMHKLMWYDLMRSALSELPTRPASRFGHSFWKWPKVETFEDCRIEATRRLRMATMEGVDEILGIGNIARWLPGRVGLIIALPLDEVLKLAPEYALVFDTFDLVLVFAFDLNGRRLLRLPSRDVTLYVFAKQGDMEHRMNWHRLGQLQFVVQVSELAHYRVGA